MKCVVKIHPEVDVGLQEENNNSNIIRIQDDFAALQVPDSWEDRADDPPDETKIRNVILTSKKGRLGHENEDSPAVVAEVEGGEDKKQKRNLTILFSTLIYFLRMPILSPTQHCT